MRNLPLTFDYSTYSQKLGEDFAKFCGLLRIYELYDKWSLVSGIQEGESDQTVTKCWQHQHTLQLCDILFTKSTISKHDRITGVAEPLGTFGIYPKQFLSILVLYIALFLDIFYSLMGSRELFFLRDSLSQPNLYGFLHPYYINFSHHSMSSLAEFK